MDRLSLVACVAVALAGASCDKDGGGESKSPPPTRERVNAVKANAADRQSPAEMCDVYAEAGKGRAFAWPGLTVEPPKAGSGWTWVNVWATWCKPCVEELPRLAEWKTRLSKAGVDVALHLVSADESDDIVAAFRRDHPKTPESMRVSDPESVTPWLGTIGVPAASLPVHVFVDPKGSIRCVRASAIDEPDYDAVETLLRGG